MAAPQATRQGQPTAISASALIKTGNGVLLSVFCSSSSSGTCTVYDNTSAASPVVVAQFTLVAGTNYPLDLVFNTGLYVALGGTAAVTVLTA